MNNMLEKTLRWLTRTPNEAAVEVLLAGLDAADRDIQEGVLQALLERRGVAGQQELVRRWDQLNERWRWKIAQHPRQISAAVRHAVLSPDASVCGNGCDALLRIREYELIPALVTATLEPQNPQAPLVAETLVQMAELLYEEVAGPRDGRRRQDPSAVRTQVMFSLQQAMERFEHHKRREIVEAFLLLAQRTDPVLTKILTQPRHPAYLVVLDLLSNSARTGIIRLLLGYLEDRTAPSAALQMIAHRRDPTLVRQWLHRINASTLPQMRPNLRRMETIAWLSRDRQILDTLGPEEQRAAVELATNSGMNRLAVFAVLKQVLLAGQPTGRQAAAAALAEFGGAEANQLVLQGLADPDPQVQAHLVAQLRPRGIPGAITHILAALNSPHEVVQQAARLSLGEFNMDRYLSTFDMLDEETRHTTGQLVVQIDTETPARLAAELKSPSRTRRLRALEAAEAMRLVSAVDSLVIGLLGDEDQFIRVAAARALAIGTSPLAHQALWEATTDSSSAVRNAAEQALEEWCQRTGWSGGEAACGASQTGAGPAPATADDAEHTPKDGLRAGDRDGGGR